ncbi:unnamed protein product, partial [Brassica rapa]
MHKPWSVPGLISGKNPPSAAAGEPPDPPLIPPDPPDPASSLSPHNFPSLSDSKTAPRSASAIRKGSYRSTVNTDKALAPQTATGSVNLDNTTMATSTAPLPTIPQPSLVEKIRRTENKTLRRFAPTTISSSGRPRVVIPDVVFKKGAEIHKDFIICYFNGRAPPFSQIQSVFNHMWGKEKRLEIHNNPLTHSALVRIPSDYLRQKILEKSIWYVGDSMFHTAQWSSIHSKSTPPLKAIKIWAHITGIPLDLRHEDGYSLIAGLIGEPKETDDFTKNLVSLTLSNVKIEVDLSQPLPAVVEFE